MAGSRTPRLRGGPFAAILALIVSAITGAARAQVPQPPLPPAGMPVGGYAGLLDATEPRESIPVAPPTYQPSPVPRLLPANARVEMGLLDTITSSIFED